ncbi:hypothetical protein BCAR13_1380006 [Paraburkholderia caribensis]|nr:hypothetical protein BCAR13_1380006 [Paraburkholderia caribensis]
MKVDELNWTAPWRSLSAEGEVVGLRRQLDREVTGRHPLCGQVATVIGRRIDNDDVLVALSDGSYVNVHLTWSLSDAGPFFG